jgi:hypothetical protein
MVQKYNEFDKVGDDELLCFFNVSEKEYDFFMYVPQDKPLEFIVSSK